MKKTISILISFVLCLSFSTIALAATDTTSTEPSTTAATTVPATTIPATTIASTVPETTAAPVETSADTTETTAPDALTDTTVSEADTTMDPQIYQNAVPDDLKRDVLTIPQTGTSTGGIAIFAILSIAAAAFVCTKKKN